jgi:hypothetical protein
MTSTQLAPALIVAFVAWRIYVRARRNIGRQPWQPRRLAGRAIFFGIVSGLLMLAVLANPPALAALGGGLVLGVPLAFLGLQLTRFEATPAGKFYTPNPWIGLGLTLLLAGRIAYRMTVLFVAPPASGPMPPQLFQSPITLVMFGLTAGYYIAYNVGVMQRGRALATQA